MGIVVAGLLGRFGNQLFSYAYARSYAESIGAQFQSDPWVGSRIFQLDDQPVTHPDLPQRCETNLTPGETDICLRSYGQQQCCMLYTKQQAQGWFQLRPQWAEVLRRTITPLWCTAHRRVGDYFGYGYPVVSRQSYLNACREFDLGPDLYWVTEESPTVVGELPDDLPFLADFYALMTSRTLLRGNSSFSWWAATLGNHEAVYSPVVDGLVGGQEHDCRFVPGNHPRLCNLEFVTDLYVRDQP